RCAGQPLQIADFPFPISVGLGGGAVALIVQKYGGTSVGAAERIKAVAARVIKRVDGGDRLVVVVSAMGQTTDELIALAREMTDEPEPRELDLLLSTGEIVTSTLLAMALK